MNQYERAAEALRLAGHQDAVAIYDGTKWEVYVEAWKDDLSETDTFSLGFDCVRYWAHQYNEKR